MSTAEYEASLCQARALLIRDLVAARLLRPVLVPTPAAGSDWTATVPPGSVWDVLAVRGSYAASGAAATRMPELFLDDGQNVLENYDPSNAGVTAGLTFIWHWTALGMNYAGSLGVSIQTAMALFTLREGYRVRVNTLNIQAADQWSSVVIYVREWSESRVVSASQYVAQTIAEQVAQLTTH